MKHTTMVVILLLVLAAGLSAQRKVFKGTVVRMEMSECVVPAGFRAAMSGAPNGVVSSCPEFTVVSDDVVYVVVGRRADQFMPLAEHTDFLLKKNELMTLSEDEKIEARFLIRQMILRGDWEREQEHHATMIKLAEKELNNSDPLRLSER